MHPCPLKVTLTLSSSCYAAAKSLQSCPTLCDPRDGSPPGSSVPGILQARALEWVAISFSTQVPAVIIIIMLYHTCYLLSLDLEPP